MSRVAVKENVLRWALDRSNQSVDALRRRFPKIGEWLEGETLPTLKQLEEFSRATTTPLGLLFLNEPPEEKLPIPHYRTMSDKAVYRPSADLLDTIQMIQRRQNWMREYVIDCGISPLPFVASAKLGDSVSAVADQMRALLRFGEAWATRYPTWDEAFRALHEAMERVGILVFANGIVGLNTSRALNPEEFRGFVLIDEYAPAVFVNSADATGARMFTLAHELAHVLYGASAVFDLREMTPAQDRMEQACNRVAAEFLVPESRMRKAWPSVQNDESRFSRLANAFKVSPIVVARRALDLNLIDRKAFLNFYLPRVEQERPSNARGGNFYASLPLRVGNRFGTAIVRSVREGRTLYSDAYFLTGLRGRTFDNYAAGIEL